MKKIRIAALLLATALLLCACGAPQSEEETPPAKQEESAVVYVPMWMEEYSVVYYDANLNRTIETGRDLTEEEIATRGDIDPSMMYGSVLAEPNT